MAARAPDVQKTPFRAEIADFFRRAFTENLIPKFVAFVLALTFFVLVQSKEQVYDGIDVRVEYNLPKDRVLVSEPPNQVRVSVSGARRQIRRLVGREVRPIRVDLTNHRRGEYRFDETSVDLPEGVSLVRFNPPSIPTRFENRVEKKAPIEVERRGSVPPGFLVARLAATPDQATISGAESTVLGTGAVRTREVDLSGKTESFTQTVALVPSDEFVEIVEPKLVEVEVKIVEELASKKLGPVRVGVRHGPEVRAAAAAKYSANPAEVTVVARGSKLALDALDPAALQAWVELFADDVVSHRTRKARVIVPRPAPGIALEISPEEVTIAPKVPVTPGKKVE
jgi:YbbR domain-containing protein